MFVWCQAGSSFDLDLVYIVVGLIDVDHWFDWSLDFDAHLRLDWCIDLERVEMDVGAKENDVAWSEVAYLVVGVLVGDERIKLNIDSEDDC